MDTINRLRGAPACAEHAASHLHCPHARDVPEGRSSHCMAIDHALYCDACAASAGAATVETERARCAAVVQGHARLSAERLRQAVLAGRDSPLLRSCEESIQRSAWDIELDIAVPDDSDERMRRIQAHDRGE